MQQKARQGTGMIDWSRVAELIEEVGRDSLDDIMPLFFEEVEEVLERLSTAPDDVTLAADMHFLKGSARNLGFVAMGDLCETAEQAAQAGEPGAVAVAGLVACYDRSKQEFLRRLPTLTGG